MAVCEFCAKPAFYTCPRCSVPYCSMTCYKCQNHNICSEEFFKEWVIEDSQGNYCKKSGREMVLDMLKKSHMEEFLDPTQYHESLSDNDDQISSEDECVENLQDRLRGLDLDRDTDKIWNRLTSKERHEFERMMENHEILNVVPNWKPWWDKYKISVVIDESFVEKLAEFTRLINKSPLPLLKCDMCAILFAYCFLNRFYNGDFKNLSDAFSQGIVQLTPCFEGKEHRPCSTVELAVIQVFQRASSIGEYAEVLDVSFTSKLMRDVAVILKAAKREAIARAFLDLLSIFQKALPMLNDARSKQDKGSISCKSVMLALKKIEFFCGCISCMSDSIFQACGDSLMKMADNWKSDHTDFCSLQKVIETSGAIKMKETSGKKLIIEEV